MGHGPSKETLIHLAAKQGARQAQDEQTVAMFKIRLQHEADLAAIARASAARLAVMSAAVQLHCDPNGVKATTLPEAVTIARELLDEVNRQCDAEAKVQQEKADAAAKAEAQARVDAPKVVGG